MRDRIGNRLAHKQFDRLHDGEMPTKLSPGGYVLKLVARDRDGRIVSSRHMGILVGDILPVEVATAVADSRSDTVAVARGGPDSPVVAADDLGPYYYLDGCFRMSGRRVDCVTREDGTEECQGVEAFELRRNGLVYVRSYGCRASSPSEDALRRRPKWTAARVVDLL
jgi:hypothetical protein